MNVGSMFFPQTFIRSYYYAIKFRFLKKKKRPVISYEIKYYFNLNIETLEHLQQLAKTGSKSHFWMLRASPAVSKKKASKAIFLAKKSYFLRFS